MTKTTEEILAQIDEAVGPPESETEEERLARKARRSPFVPARIGDKARDDLRK